MRLKNKLNLTHYYLFVEKNNFKILLVVGIFFLLNYLLTLPYLNLLVGIFKYFPHVISLFLILIIFRPQKNLLLITSCILFISAYPFLLLSLTPITEGLGVISYFLLATYVVIAIRETFFNKE
jgi:hypothetical protein